MSEANKELVRRHFEEIFNREDRDEEPTFVGTTNLDKLAEIPDDRHRQRSSGPSTSASRPPARSRTACNAVPWTRCAGRRRGSPHRRTKEE